MPMLTMLRTGLPVWPSQVAAAHLVGEPGHPVEHGVDLGHDVGAVHRDDVAPGRPQGHVQHGPVLGDVDLLALEHGLDPGAQAGLLRQLQQQPQGLVGDRCLE